MGERDRGSAMAIDGPGNRHAPHRSWTISRRRGREGRMKWWAMAGSPVPWCTCRNADMESDRGTRSPTGPQMPVTGDPGLPLDVARRSARISVLFLFSPYRGRLKWPHLHCQADAVA